MESDSEYKKVNFFELAGKKVMIVKTITGEGGHFFGHFNKLEVDQLDVKDAVVKSKEERESEAYNLNCEFDDAYM